MIAATRPRRHADGEHHLTAGLSDRPKDRPLL
jgi:hypothetical protein